MARLLGIDVGTSATKTVLFDEVGRVVASRQHAYDTSHPQNGWAEQNPADWWTAVCETIKACLADAGCDPAEITAIGLTGQMHGLVMLDAAGEVLRPAIIWSDQRATAECEAMTETVGHERLLAITGNPALPSFTAAKLLWVRTHEPALYARCRHILLPKDYIRYRLSGIFASEVSDASGMQLLDIHARGWSAELLAALALDAAWLPDVFESVVVSAEVSAAAARATGLKAGTPIVGGAGDNAAAAVGTGIIKAGDAFITIGTSGVVYAHTEKPRYDRLGRIHTFCAAVPEEWHVMGVTQAAGLSYKWAAEMFCRHELEQAAATGESVYRLMDALAASAPPGANRLLFLPYLMGERTPHLDPYARGVFFGLSAIHKRGDILRAILEGVAYSLRDCQLVIAETGIRPAAMTVTGGGAHRLWRQLLADICDLPMRSLATGEGAALGVALLAGVAAGVYKDLAEACAVSLQPGDESVPDPANRAVYQAGHAVYQGIYRDLEQRFRQLAAL